MDNDVYITIKNAAKVTGISKSDLYRLCGENRIKNVRPNGPSGRIYLKKSWIDEYFESLIEVENNCENKYKGIVSVK